MVSTNSNAQGILFDPDRIHYCSIHNDWCSPVSAEWHGAAGSSQLLEPCPWVIGSAIRQEWHVRIKPQHQTTVTRHGQFRSLLLEMLATDSQLPVTVTESQEILQVHPLSTMVACV